jgi:hypothetical protein
MTNGRCSVEKPTIISCTRSSGHKGEGARKGLPLPTCYLTHKAFLKANQNYTQQQI